MRRHGRRSFMAIGNSSRRRMSRTDPRRRPGTGHFLQRVGLAARWWDSLGSELRQTVFEHDSLKRRLTARVGRP